jgi:hypothetical protein
MMVSLEICHLAHSLNNSARSSCSPTRIVPSCAYTPIRAEASAAEDVQNEVEDEYEHLKVHEMP